MNEITATYIGERAKDLADVAWLIDQFSFIEDQLSTPSWGPGPATENQIGYLVGLMDIANDEDRYALLGALLGHTPVETSRDLTKWEASVLIGWYKDNGSEEINTRLGIVSRAAFLQEKRAARQAERDARQARILSERRERRAQRSRRTPGTAGTSV